LKEPDLEADFYVYDFEKKTYKITDKSDFVRVNSPTMTFKIPNFLIVIEVGVNKDNNDLIK
jgi:beta-lactamase class D